MTTTTPEQSSPSRERALLALDIFLFPVAVFLPVWLAKTFDGSGYIVPQLALAWSAWTGVLLIASAMSLALKFGLIVSEPGKREGLGAAALAVAALAAIASTFSMVHGVVYWLAAGVIAVAAWCPMKRYDRYLTSQFTWEHTLRFHGDTDLLMSMYATYLIVIWLFLFVTGPKGWQSPVDVAVMASSAWLLRRGALLLDKRWEARKKELKLL